MEDKYGHLLNLNRKNSSRKISRPKKISYKFAEDLICDLGLCNEGAPFSVYEAKFKNISGYVLDSMLASDNERDSRISFLHSVLGNVKFRGNFEGTVLYLEIFRKDSLTNRIKTLLGKPTRYNITYFPRDSLPVPFERNERTKLSRKL